LWPNGWMHQDATWYGGRPQPRGLCVGWGPSPPLLKKGDVAPNFRPISIAAKRLDGSRRRLTWRWALVQATLCCMGTRSPPQEKGAEFLQFSAHFIVAKRLDTSRWHLVYGCRPQPRRLCVRWGPRPLPQKGRSPQFSTDVYCGQTAALIKVPLGKEVGLPRPTRHCVRWGTSSPSPKRGTAPNFRPVSVVPKRLDGIRCHLVWR